MYEMDDLNDTIRERIRLLPAWFCERMVSKEGHYALVLDGGVIVAIHKITTIHQDNNSNIWLDVLLMPYPEAEVYLSNGGVQSRPIIGSSGPSNKATINAKSIVMAYELDIPGE